MLTYENRTTDVTPAKLKTANVRRNQIIQRKFTVYDSCSCQLYSRGTNYVTTNLTVLTVLATLF